MPLDRMLDDVAGLAARGDAATRGPGQPLPWGAGPGLRVALAGGAPCLRAALRRQAEAEGHRLDDVTGVWTGRSRLGGGPAAGGFDVLVFDPRPWLAGPAARMPLAPLLDAMRGAGLRRLVAVSSILVEGDPAAPRLYRWFHRPCRMDTALGLARMEAMIEASGLDWTLVRLSRPAPRPDGPVIARDRRLAEGSFRIHAEDAAAFVLREAWERRWRHRHPALGYL